MKQLLFALSLFFLLCTQTTTATQPVVRSFNSKLIKSGTQTWDIQQHENDWMYFANNKGLLEFDGNKWTIYPIKNFTTIRSLFYDKAENKMYTGAFNEFGYYTKSENGALHYSSLIDLLAEKDRSFNEIWNIHKLENSIIFQGNNEVFKFSGNKIQRINSAQKIDCSAVVHNTLIVSTTAGGPAFLNGNMFLGLPKSDILKNKKICAILPYKNNKVLFVTEFSGLYLFDGEATNALPTDIDGFMTENQVFCAAIDNDKLALGTVRKGLVVKDLKTNQNIYSNNASGIQNNTVLSIAFDNRHNIWLGLDKGIDYVQINSSVYDLIGNSSLYGSGYTSFMQNNTLYLGTNQGLYITDYPVRTTPGPTPLSLMPHMQGQVWSLAEIDHTLFCGTDHGAFIIKNKTASPVSGITGTWGFRELKKHPGYILGCSYQGFFILKKNGTNWQLNNYVKGFSETGGMFEEDSDGNIWFNHWIKGIFRLQLSDDLSHIRHIDKYGANQGLPSDRDNTLYRIDNRILFSTQNGFFRYNQQTAKIERAKDIETIFGRPNHSVKLSENSAGDIWCTSYNYIGYARKIGNGRFKVDSLSFVSLKDKLINGFEHLNFISNNAVIISTEDGFSWLNLSDNVKKKTAFKLAIRCVTLSNDSMATILSGKEGTEFDYSHNSVQFEYVAPEFRKEGAVMYSYFLENFDTNWSAYNSANTKEYTRLGKGNYIFRVKAINLIDGNISETSYTFSVQPPWYESKIAYFIYALAFIALIILLLRYIQHRSEMAAKEVEVRKEEELKEQEKKYEDEAREKRKEIMELKNQRLQYDLRHKSQELANSTMNLIRKNEILMDISSNLDKVTVSIHEQTNTKDAMHRITKIQKEIKENIEQDNNWKKFAENFDLVYENFLKRLGEEFPDLTVSDKKLCAYLKMDLSSKDIAPLLNISYRSVEMSRYRLRKKLGLERDDNLTDFLQKY